MTYPLVRDLAAEGIPVAVTCRVLGFSTQAFYAWCTRPCSDRDWDDAKLINAILDIHCDDPAFGYRFITDELHKAGWSVCENRVQRLCQQQGIWSATVAKSKVSRRPLSAVHDDLVQRDFTAAAPDTRWVGDITEHPTGRTQSVVATPACWRC